MDEEKYRILQVHNYYQIPGGEDTVVANEKKLLENYGHTVIQYTRNNSELKEFSKFRRLLLPFTTIFNPKTYQDIKRIIKAEHIDIVHVHNTLNLISPAVYYAALKCEVPVVQTVHNFRLLCPGATFYRDGHICEDCVEHGLHCAVKHSCYRGSKAQTLVCVVNTWIHRMIGVYGKLNYICLTEFNKKKLLQLKQIKPERVYIKPNFTFDTTVVPDASGNSGGVFKYFLFIGRVEKIKGLDVLLSAFAGLQNEKLVIAGTGTDLEKYKSAATDNVTFTGFLSRDELNRIMAKAKAVIVPSQWYETFGMVIIEAFSNAVPVIVGDIGNIGILVNEDINGKKFIYDSADSLADAIEEYSSMDQSKLRLNARRHYTDYYSPEVNYNRLMEIYKAIR